MMMVEELIKITDPRSFSEVEGASRIMKYLNEISQFVLNGHDSVSENQDENIVGRGVEGRGEGRGERGGEGESSELDTELIQDLPGSVRGRERAKGRDERGTGRESVGALIFSTLVYKVNSIISLLNEKNWRILESFSDLPSLSLPPPLLHSPSLRTQSPSNPATEAMNGKGKSDSMTFGLQNIISSLFLISAAKDCILKGHTNDVTDSSYPSDVTQALAAVLVRTFCSGSISNRIAFLSTVLSASAKARPGGYHAKILDLHGDEDSAILLSQYYADECFVVPLWAGGETVESQCTDEGRGERGAEETICSVPVEDLFAICSRTFCTPSFLHALIHFGVLNGNPARTVKMSTERGLSVHGARVHGRGRNDTDTVEGSKRQTAQERAEEGARLSVRLKSLSLSLVDSLMRCALSQLETSKKYSLISSMGRGVMKERGNGVDGVQMKSNFSDNLSESWCHALPLLKLLEWKTYKDDRQGGDMQAKESMFGQSPLSLFIQELEDDSNSNSNSNINSNSNSSRVVNDKSRGSASNRSSAYGRSMVLGIFHAQPSVRASSALRLRHELSGLRAPCEATARHTHEYALISYLLF